MRSSSRPATYEEWQEDYAKREAALELAIKLRELSPQQIERARRELLEFDGYPRPRGRFPTTPVDTQRPPPEISPPTGPDKKSRSGKERHREPDREGQKK